MEQQNNGKWIVVVDDVPLDGNGLNYVAHKIPIGTLTILNKGSQVMWEGRMRYLSVDDYIPFDSELEAFAYQVANYYKPKNKTK